jgi:OOP family OmpA-OmpF porin
MTFTPTSHILRQLGYGLVLTSAVALAGCSSFEQGHPGNPASASHNVDNAKAALNSSGTGFTGDLAANYYAMATIREKDHDSVDADYWARKSLAAAHGQVVPPEQMKVVAETSPEPLPEGAKQETLHATGWNVPGLADPSHSPNVQALHDGRGKLVNALDNGGRDRFPSVAARSQAFYDCWIERSEANVSGDPRFAACQTGFVKDYTDLHVLLNPPGQRNAYFAYNSATLTPEGQQQIADAVAFIKDGTAKLRITGKADRSGSNDYNMKLSQARAQAVRDAAIADGLPSDRIVVAWSGESQLPVATKNGVREQHNRVVQIDTVMPASQVAELPPAE